MHINHLMSMKKRINSLVAIIRHKADKALKFKVLSALLIRPKTHPNPGVSSNQKVSNLEAETRKLNYQLGEHQIELEMQNAELLLANEKALSSMERYSELIEFAPSGYFTLSKEGIIIELNLAGAQLLGKGRAQFIKTPFSSYISVDSKPVFYRFFEVLFTGKVKEFCEVTLLSDNKRPTYIYLSGMVFENKEQCLITAVDISRRKLAEKEVIKLQKAIENSKASVVITDQDGNIEYANPYFSQLSGYTREEYTGKNPAIIKSGYHSKEYYKELWDTIKSGQTWEGEFLNQKKNGQLYWENAIISPVLNDKNEIIHFVAIKTDITSAKKINLELIKAKEHAEESDNLKTAFLNNISHEIRTPFNGILGFLSLIQNDDVTHNERDEYIALINASAQRLINTINDIAEISQIQARQVTVTLTETDIFSLTSELFDRFTYNAEIKGLKFHIKNDLPQNLNYINTDRIKLNSILNSLISNGIKFTKEGSVCLGIRLNDSQTDYIEFSITDTGIGIPENQQQTIFEQFRQGDGSNTRQFEGLGLGISIAKAYVELLGGSIWVASDIGKGSTFRFTVPINSIPEETRINQDNASEKNNTGQMNKLKILIVEDDETSSILLSMATKPFSKEIIKVRTGVDAVEACRNNTDIDLILLDIKMPDMDGYEAARQIRQFNPDVVIIAQTAYALQGDQEKTIAAGCTDYISKPIKKEKLEAMVKKYFQNNE